MRADEIMTMEICMNGKDFTRTELLYKVFVGNSNCYFFTIHMHVTGYVITKVRD